MNVVEFRHLREQLSKGEGYSLMLSSDENMLKPVLPGLRLTTPLSSSRNTWVLLELIQVIIPNVHTVGLRDVMKLAKT